MFYMYRIKLQPKLIKIFYCLLLYGIPTTGALAQSFHSSISPLSSELQKKLVGNKIWHTGCPVALDDLRLVSVGYYDFEKKPHTGELILNKSAAPDAVRAFSNLYAHQFPISRLSTLVSFKGDRQSAEEENTSYGFICKEKSSEEKTFSQTAYGNVITINPVQNPRLDLSRPKQAPSRWCTFFHSRDYCEEKAGGDKFVSVFPSRGLLSINRNLKLKGMNETIVPLFSQSGFVWSGQHVDTIAWGKFTHEEN
jgi:hypothetical protein